MLMTHLRIDRWLPAPPLRSMPAAQLTYPIKNVSSEPTRCASLAYRPDPGTRGITSHRGMHLAHPTPRP